MPSSAARGFAAQQRAMATLAELAKRFELHAHTTASDGVLTPSAHVEYAAARGLAALAVTDHDTLRGVPETAARGAELGIEVARGIQVHVLVQLRDALLSELPSGF